MPLKLFFDECLSVKLPRLIRDVYVEDYPGLETEHLTDKLKKGTEDQEWLADLDKDWIVITNDRGKDAKKPKLPVLCSKFLITHISLTTDLMHDGYRAHKQALLSVWPQIVMVPRIPRGTKVALGYRWVNKGVTKIFQLTIESKPFDIWCHEKGIKQPKEEPKQEQKPARKPAEDLFEGLGDKPN